MKEKMKEKIPAQPPPLSRETIRELANDKLVHINGGCDTTSYTTQLVTAQ
jgi:hypothetical protein